VFFFCFTSENHHRKFFGMTPFFRKTVGEFFPVVVVKFFFECKAPFFLEVGSLEHGEYPTSGIRRCRVSDAPPPQL